MKVYVDLKLCSGHAHCAQKCPEVFDTDDALGKCVILQETVPDDCRDKVRKAIRSCPEGALRVA